ncbi:MAG: type IV pilin, partial [Pseudomonadota bacterium]
MISLVIVGILAAITYPSYTRYVIKVRRVEAKVGLMSLAAKM